jgi:hypothetical protein
MEDTATTRNWGTRLRSAYYALVGDSPRLKPDDRTGAAAHLARVEAALEHGGWTRGEWRRLHRMKKVWTARANGEDSRFKLVGTRQGGLTQMEQGHRELLESIQRVTKMTTQDRRNRNEE